MQQFPDDSFDWVRQQNDVGSKRATHKPTHNTTPNFLSNLGTGYFAATPNLQGTAILWISVIPGQLNECRCLYLSYYLYGNQRNGSKLEIISHTLTKLYPEFEVSYGKASLNTSALLNTVPEGPIAIFRAVQ